MQQRHGSIKWPTALEHDAFEKYGYVNPLVQRALDAARPSIISIIFSSMEQQHPIIQDYAGWSKKHKGILESFKNTCFSYDILPGNACLSGEAAVFLSQNLPTDMMPGLDQSRARKNLPVVWILFDLVVLWVYLGRPATNDAQVYYLARKYSKEELDLLSDADVQSSPSSGYLQRHLSLPESALAASVLRLTFDSRWCSKICKLNMCHLFR